MAGPCQNRELQVFNPRYQPEMKNPSRIVIVDDNPALSADFRAALETQPDLSLAAAVTCASCSFGAVSAHRPDLVLLSLSMPDHRVLDLVKDLQVLHAGLKLLIVSGHEQELEAGRVLRAGAHGCIPTSRSTAARLEAVRQILAGRPVFDTHSSPALHPCLDAALAL